VEAIVMTPQVNVLSAPSEDGTEIFTIHEGLKVKIVNKSGNWNEIRLSDGNVGWLLASEIEEI
jgi:SH3-like domain-containing protein